MSYLDRTRADDPCKFFISLSPTISALEPRHLIRNEYNGSGQNDSWFIYSSEDVGYGSDKIF